MAAFRLTAPFIPACASPARSGSGRATGRGSHSEQLPLPTRARGLRRGGVRLPLQAGVRDGPHCVLAKVHERTRSRRPACTARIAGTRSLRLLPGAPLRRLTAPPSAGGGCRSTAACAAAIVGVPPRRLRTSRPWWGGEAFGAAPARRHATALAVLLVPAVPMPAARTRWMHLFGLALALVRARGAARSRRVAGPLVRPSRPRSSSSTWWHPTDNEIVTMLTSGSTWPRAALMTAIALGGIAVASISQAAW